MPERVDNCVESVLDDNPELDKEAAYAICQDMENKGQLSEGCPTVDLEAECPDGSIMVGGECREIPTEDVEVPPSMLSKARIMATASPLDTQPIEREELGDGKVAYRNIKLLDTGVWTDESSRTPTLYDETTFENTDPVAEGAGPPVNIAHDLNSNGEPNEASVGGYVEPESVQTDGQALFGDIIVDTEEAAGAYADENLQSALESQGEVGFSPSVELTPTEMANADHPQAEDHVKAAELTGLGLVRDPASKSVDFKHETRNRAVALASTQESKSVWVKSDSMNAGEIRERLNLSDEIDDETLVTLAEADVLRLEDDEDDEEDEEDIENQEGEDEEEEEMPDEEEDEMDMADEAIEMLEEEIDEVWAEIEELRDAMLDEAMTEEMADADEVEALAAAKEDLEKELSDVKAELEEKEKRLSKVEEEPKDPKTLSDGDNSTDNTSGNISAIPERSY